MSDDTLTGGCLCGAVRYKVTGPAVFTGVCHCANCQRATGSAFSMALGVPADAVALEGATTRYTFKGDSGGDVTRSFCPVCGSPVTSDVAMMQGITIVEVGTLDTPGAITPGAHIYCRSKLEWVAVPEGVGAFETMPPMG